MKTSITLTKHIAALDESVSISSNIKSLNFTGSGVTASNLADAITITIPGQSNLITENAQTNDYILALSDSTVATIVTINKATANTITVPTDISVPFPIGTQIVLSSLGVGQTTIVAAGGVTINSSGGKLKIADQYSGATLIKLATNTWLLFGNLSA